MEEIDIALITQRSIRGIFALTSRTFFIQLISFAANFLLTIFLTPAIFGVYFIVSAAIAFLSYFSDIGLAAALIQKKRSHNRRGFKNYLYDPANFSSNSGSFGATIGKIYWSFL